MFRLNIYKNDKNFSLELKISDDYKNVLKNIKFKKYNPSTTRWTIPITEFDNYLTNIRKITDESMIKIIESDNLSEDDRKNVSSDDDDSSKKKKPKMEEKEIEIRIRSNMIIIEEFPPKEIVQIIKSIKGSHFNTDLFALTIDIYQLKEFYEKMNQHNINLKQF
ncbi:unnamed protein product [Brachionus calyciflorus]|uniref:Uncharacterized protein n=1 Tax=Brachionus calyciflorus TaxID=104777 RepID=A0A814LN41_9BILA|nr:unnamed protein product [Brachionus calyciflorus]